MKYIAPHHTINPEHTDTLNGLEDGKLILSEISLTHQAIVIK